MGDRVAYAGVQGAYAELRTVPAARLVPLPATIDDRTAAAMMLKGLTAEYLLRRCARVQPGDTILFHAAAGGVGSIACQWARHLGVRVIGTAGGPEKVKLALARGCAHVIDYTQGGPEQVVARVKELTGGKGVPVVFDSVGKDTFSASLDCLPPRGLLVSFGNASGVVPPFSPPGSGRSALALPHAARARRLRRDARRARRGDARALRRRRVRAPSRSRSARPTRCATPATAHRDLEARKTTGSTRAPALNRPRDFVRRGGHR